MCEGPPVAFKTQRGFLLAECILMHSEVALHGSCDGTERFPYLSLEVLNTAFIKIVSMLAPFPPQITKEMIKK